MKAAILEEIGVIKVGERPDPVCGPDDVIIKQQRVGVCGSDVHYWKNGRIGSAVLTLPTVIGHESSGEVAEVGKNVTDLKVGDRVTPDPGCSCGKCYLCRLGDYNLCQNGTFQGTPSGTGCQVEYLAWPAAWTYKIPEHLSFEEGALVEPLNVAHYGVKRGRLQGGEVVLITGSGTIGLCALQMSLAFGASQIIISDFEAGRLEMARSMGASQVVALGETQLTEAIDQLTQGRGVDITIECSGAEQAARDAIAATRRGGRVVLVGMFHQDEFPLPVMSIIRRQIAVIPSFRYSNSFKPTLDMLAAGRFPHAKDMVTHHFPLDQVETALVYTDERRDGAIKCMLSMD